jgi:hypothetical protein
MALINIHNYAKRMALINIHNYAKKMELINIHKYERLEAPRSLYSSPGYNNNISQ